MPVVNDLTPDKALPILKTQEVSYDSPDSSHYFKVDKGHIFCATKEAVRMYSEETIRKCHAVLLELAEKYEGLDYLQVFVDIDKKENLWFMENQIDEVRNKVTALLPSNY